MTRINKQIKSIAFVGVFAAMAMVLSYLESLIPPISATLPGIKMGLPNIVIIFVLYRFGVARAIAVSAIRILISSLLFGSFTTFAYSVAGAVLSLAIMCLLKKINCFSSVGVSVIGGISHNIGQIAMAVLLLSRAEIGYYLIVLTLSGTIAGLLVGLCGALLIAKLKNIKI